MINNIIQINTSIFHLFLKGCALGFAMAVPVGPIGILCIRRTLAYGIAIGFASGLGAATADAIYGIIAGYGLTVVSEFLLEQRFILTLAGSLFLAYLGIKIFLAPPPKQTTAATRGSNILGAYLSTLFLTLSNPMTIISFTAIVASAGIAASVHDTRTIVAFVAGIFFGSALWWLFLSSLVGLVRVKSNDAFLYWTGKISGVAIFLFAISVLIHLLGTL